MTHKTQIYRRDAVSYKAVVPVPVLHIPPVYRLGSVFWERERECLWNPYSLGVQRGKRLSVGSSTLPSTGSFRSAPHLSLSFLGFEWYILDLESRHLFCRTCFPASCIFGQQVLIRSGENPLQTSTHSSKCCRGRFIES